MGKEEAGTQDGTGPYRNSFQTKQGREGRRTERGESCPEK